MSAYRDHARAIADELGVLPGVEVRPQPVQTSMMHVVLPVTAEDLRRRALAIARDELTWTWPHAFASDGPARQRIELTVGDATLAIEPPEVRRLVERLVSDEVAAR